MLIRVNIIDRRTDRQTDRQTHQNYSSEPHNILDFQKFVRSKKFKKIIFKKFQIFFNLCTKI